MHASLHVVAMLLNGTFHTSNMQHYMQRVTKLLSYQGYGGAGTRWNAFPANILEPERRSGKYRWPQVER